MSSLKDLLRWYNNKDIVPTLEALQKTIVFYHDKNIDMLKLGCTLPNLANICLHKFTDAKFYFSQRQIKTYWKKIEKTLLVIHLSLLHAKQLLMKLLSDTVQTYANLLLGLMPANYTPTRCVNSFPRVFIRVGISIQKPVDSHFDKTRPVALKIWSCLIFSVQDLIVKLRASTLQVDRLKLTASVLMGFVHRAIICNKIDSRSEYLFRTCSVVTSLLTSLILFQLCCATVLWWIRSESVFTPNLSTAYWIETNTISGNVTIPDTTCSY